MAVASPCISVCTLDDESGLCEGCCRTAIEIADWLYYSDEQKRAVLNALTLRREQRAQKESA